MADVFTTRDVSSLLTSKVMVFIGDSNIRALYKDLLWLLNYNTLIDNSCLRRRLEKSFLGDNLESSSSLTKSRDFFEVRTFKGNHHYVKFYFVTRCYCNIVTDYLKEIREKKCPIPDVIIMNSCLWDVTRWGPNGVDEFKENMVKLMELLKESLPPKTLFIWATALPISLKSIRGGLIIKQIEFMEQSLRFHIMEANLFTKTLVDSHGFDVVDFHFHLQFQLSRRSCDGVHYLPLPVRLQTNLYLTHIALSWGDVLPIKGDMMFIVDERILAAGKTVADCKTERVNWCPSGNERLDLSQPSIGSPGQKQGRPNKKGRCRLPILPQPSLQPSVTPGWPYNYIPNQSNTFNLRATLPRTNLRLNHEAVMSTGCVVREPVTRPGLLPTPAPWQHVSCAPVPRQQFQHSQQQPFSQQSSTSNLVPSSQARPIAAQPRPLLSKSQLKRLQHKSKFVNTTTQNYNNHNNCRGANAFIRMLLR